jgi:Uma2 family endonuclease
MPRLRTIGPSLAGARLRPPFRRAYPVAMPSAPTYWTADMVRELPDDGNRYELVWGELLVNPTPATVHQRIVRRLLVALDGYRQRFGLGEVFDSPAEVSWSGDTYVQPDVFVVSPVHGTNFEWKDVKHLRLVAEVLSPRTAKNDRFQKRKLYQAHGVETLLIVDPVKRVVEVWTPDSEQPVIESTRVTWHPTGATEPLVIELASLFA